MIEIATQVGIAPTEQITRLFNDGCTADYIPVEQAWPAIRHFATAQLRYYLGLDPEPVGLGRRNRCRVRSDRDHLRERGD